jgi:predicted flap endonuclease-1-like 5' DNA nuclease
MLVLQDELRRVVTRLEALEGTPSLDSAALETLLERMDERIDAFEGAALDRARRLDGFEGAAGEQARRLEALARRVGSLEDGGSPAMLASDTSGIKLRVDRMDARLDRFEQRLSASESPRDSKGTLDDVVDRLGVLEARSSEGAVALRDRLAGLEERTSAQALEIAELRDVAAARERLVEELRERAATKEESSPWVSASDASPTPVPSTADVDALPLTNIRGIGPKFQRMLHALGVTSVSQVAAWEDADVERIAEALNIPASRIRKADWVAHARELAG